MARQNLKRRIARETNEARKAGLVARLNPLKFGRSVSPPLSPNRDEVVTINDGGEVEHEHTDNCHHDREDFARGT